MHISLTLLHRVFNSLLSKMDSSSINTGLIKQCKTLIPELSNSKHKGQCGRVGVFGGSKDFTGAPYFAGISALKTGADLVYIFCTESAALPIKCYSPELMVIPYLDVDMSPEEELNWLKKLHSAVIGPGLGRDKKVIEKIISLIPILSGVNIPLVLDADALYVLSKHPGILNGYSNDVYLTPNIMEFKLLCSAILCIDTVTESNVEHFAQLLSDKIGSRVTIIVKGKHDSIACGKTKLNYEEIIGSPRRCGGQGDILSGCLGIFAFWASLITQKEGNYTPQLLAAFTACVMVKLCNRQSFELKGRSMTATDMLEKVPLVFDNLFDDKWKYSMQSNR